MPPKTVNMPASVHQRLLNKAKESGRPFNELLQYFAMERFIYRLSKSGDVSRFILKGALLLPVWSGPVSRPTKDIDLLGKIDNRTEVIISAMKKICNQDVEPDGMIFDADSISAKRITEDANYEGVRIRVRSHLGNAEISLQIDIGFGDVIIPAPIKISYPVILEFPAPELNGYTMESVIAEKFEAMVKLGALNSRMKDFYDIWFLSYQFPFDGKELASAIQRTFSNRNTEISTSPIVFETSFATPAKETQWRAFINKSGITGVPFSLALIIPDIAKFLEPICRTILEDTSFSMKWNPTGPWK